MTQVFFAEWRKLRRPTLFYGTLASVVGVTALITSLLYLLIDSEQGNANGGEIINRMTLATPHGITIGFSGSAGLLGLVALCVFASQTAQEYTYGTLRNLLVRQPKRLTLLLGKFVSMSVFTLISVLLSAIVSVAIAFSLAGTAEVATDAWTTSAAGSELIHTFVNVLLSVIAMGTIGMILGLLLRSPISAISIGLAWLMVVENLIAAVVHHSAKWMPGQMITTISSGGDHNASYSYALIYLAIFLVISFGLVAFLFQRRDVSN